MKVHNLQSVFFRADESNKEYTNDCEKLENWRNCFIKIKNAWDKVGVDYIFHKSIGQFPYMSDNLDILVRAENFEKAGRILRDIGYVDLRNVQEPHKKFYRKFAGGECWAPIHLHERVCWAVPYENIEHLWKHYVVSEKDEVVHYPCREDAILINTAHCFLEDHLIKIRDLLTIRKSIGKNKINWNYIIKTADEMHWLFALYTGFLIFDYLYMKLFKEYLIPYKIIREAKEHVNNKRWIRKTLERKIFVDKPKMPFKIPHLWTRRHSSLRVLNDPAFGKRFKRYLQIFEHLLDGFIHLKLGIKTHPKMFVAISGLDGSGKTKHSEALQNAFKTCEINPVYIWSRAGSLPITRFVLKFVKYFKSGKYIKIENSLIKEESYLPKNQLTIKLWRMINTIDLILYYFFRFNIPLILGKVVIADRYICDSIIDLEFVGKSNNFDRILYKVLKILTPTPNILFLLDLNPDIILVRGCDEAKVELVNRRKYYKMIMSKTNTIIIDNSNPFDEVSGRILNFTLTKFFAKYPEKYNGYRLVSLKYK